MASCTGQCAELACVPSAIAPEDREAHFKLAKRLFQQLAHERADLPDGYVFRFPAEALELVARFVANERRCCPFLKFELSVAGADGPLWLRMTGPEGTRAVLQAELALARWFGALAPSLVAPGWRSAGQSTGMKLAAGGGILGALAVISCGILPLILLVLGAGAAWVSRQRLLSGATSQTPAARRPGSRAPRPR